MSILCLEKGSATRGELSVTSAPIIAAITSLSHKDRAELCKKFDIVFLLAKEKLSFHKYPSISELEERHDTQLGSIVIFNSNDFRLLADQFIKMATQKYPCVAFWPPKSL